MRMNAENVAINLGYSSPQSFIGEFGNRGDLRKELWDPDTS